MFTRYQQTKLQFYVTPLVLGMAVVGAERAIFGADRRTLHHEPPQLLAEAVLQGAQPLRPKVVSATPELLGRVIRHHDAGEHDRAIAIWQRITLPVDQLAWKHIALGVAHLQCERFEDAAEEFALAKQLAREHAVVHYFSGLLWMEREAAVDRDATDGKPQRTYQGEAISELNLAVKYARSTHLTTPLISSDEVVIVPYPLPRLAAPPLAKQLLEALGADNYLTKAHGLLAHLYTEVGCPEKAEHHLEQAQDGGISVPYGYRLIAVMYEARGRTADARRAYHQARHAGDQLAHYGRTVLQQMDHALDEQLRTSLAEVTN